MNDTQARIQRAAFFVEVRLRLARVVRILPIAIALVVLPTILALGAHKIWPELFTKERTIVIFVAEGALLGVGLLLRLLWPLAPKAGTIALDRHYRLHDRLTNAVAFSQIPPAQRTELMQAAIDDAQAHAKLVKPRKVAPLYTVVGATLASPETVVAALAIGGLAAVALLEIGTPREEAVVAPPELKAGLAMEKDDLDLFKDAAKALDRPNQSPEMKAAIERFNRLIEDLAAKRLDRAEAFRQMEDIERDLNKNLDADQDLLKKELNETGKDLSQNDLTKELAEALKKNDLAKAIEKMKALSEELKRSKKPLDKAAKERLAAALKAAGERRKEAMEKLDEKRASLKQSLLRRESEVAAETNPQSKAEKQRLLDQDKRELKRLDDQAERDQRIQRELSKLDQDLAKAAADLMKDLDLASQDLEQAAEDINRMQEEQMSDKDKEELKQRLEELREILRQQGQGGKKRLSRMKNFSKRAHGKKGSGKKSGGGDLKRDQPGQEGEGEEGEGEEGEGQEGEGDQPGGMGGLELKRGNGSGGIPIPGAGQPGGNGQPGGDQPGGDGSEPGGGKSWGHGAGPKIAGDKSTEIKSDTTEVHQDGFDTGQGSSNSKSIMVAAEKGFQGDDYKRVFTDYRTRAEDDMNQEEVPDGYRFYVKRYFQLIRPRD
ncbi:MAG: hypothetical protein U0414_38690 [Polyangiaceae bacterium]